jgi:hypothetical protein
MRRRFVFTLSVLWAAITAMTAMTAACSDDSMDSGTSGQGAAGRNAGGTSGTPPAMSNAGSTAAGASGAGRGGASGGVAGMAAGGSGSSGMFTKMGVCGRRGMSTVNATSFMGTEEFYILADRGFGDDICVVKFDVKRVGEAPAGCDDPAADVDCLWTHQVEYSNPMKTTDVDGVCANSQLGLTAAKLDEIDGSRASYGFVSEFAGHNSVMMWYDASKSAWDAFGNATYEEQAGALRFDRREGICNY